MRRQLQGITVVLFGILLAVSSNALGNALNCNEMVFFAISIIIGVIGVVMTFRPNKKE